MFQVILIANFLTKKVIGHYSMITAKLEQLYRKTAGYESLIKIYEEKLD